MAAANDGGSLIHIARYETAIRRKDLSLPVKCAVADGLIAPTVTVLDFGCGHGENIELLNAQGIECRGWDPVFRSHEPLAAADVVNLGYVINVIEDPAERAATLGRAWELSAKVLVVAAQIKMPGRGRTAVEFGDGVLTGRGTFQRFYLALARFRRRPPISKLPLGLQRDIREFFGNYTRACEQADELLFRAGQAEAIDEACQRSPVGKLLPNALYLHVSALDALEPLLRIYEGCARAYLGEIADANVVKLHRFSGKLSYPGLFMC